MSNIRTLPAPVPLHHANANPGRRGWFSALALSALALSALAALAPGQGPRLLHDVVAGSESSHPYGFTDFFGLTLFVATTPAHGPELWVTDSTPAGTRMVADINPGVPGSHPSDIAVVGDFAFFLASGPNGSGLWQTDGTAAGTREVRAGWSGRMHALGEKVFVVQDSSIVMWQGGRERVIHQTADQSRITDLGTFAGGVLFGTQETNGNVGAAWWHDGTLSASRQLVRLGKAPFSGEAVANERAAWLLLTRAQDLAPELWRWDGSAAPQMVAKFEYAEPWRLSRHPRLLCADGGRVLFRAWQPATGSELWRADGSPEGTKLVADIEPGPMSSEPRNMLRVGTRLMFSATTVEHGEEPWVTDGGDSTSILRDIMPGPGSSLSEFTVFYPVGGFTAYFAARDLTGNRLWKSNGSTVTNRLGVTDPYNLGFSNGILYFQAFDSTHGREVWGLQPNVATVQTLGHGCAALTPATPPTIAASLPILGQTFLLNGTTAGSSGLNVLVFGAKAVRPIALSNDCRIYYSAVDIMLSTYVTGSRWQIGVPVPNDPALLYTHAVTQGVLFGMGPGVDLTPAVAFTLGG